MSDFGETISALPLLQTVSAPAFVPIVYNGATYKLQLYPVTADRISAGAVTGTAIAADTITAANIAPFTIGVGQINPSVFSEFVVGPNTIGTTQLQSGAVTSAIIGAGAVGTIQLGALAVTTAKIALGAVGTAQIAAGAITASQITAGSIGTTEIASGGITNVNLAPNSVGPTNIQAQAVSTTQIADGSVTNVKLNPSFFTTLAATLTGDPSFISAIVAAAPFAGLTSLNSLFGAVVIGDNGGSGLTFGVPTSSRIQISDQATPLALSCLVNASTGNDVITNKIISAGQVTVPFATINGALNFFNTYTTRHTNVTIIVQTNISDSSINFQYFDSVTVTNDPNNITFFPVVTITPSGSSPYALNAACMVHIEGIDFNIATWNTNNNIFTVSTGGCLKMGASIVTLSGTFTFGSIWYTNGTLTLANTNLTSRPFSVQVLTSINGSYFFTTGPNALFVLGDVSNATLPANQQFQLGSTLTALSFLNLARGSEFNMDATFAISHTLNPVNVVGTRATMDTFSRAINTQNFVGSNAQMLGGNTGTLFSSNPPVMIQSGQETVWSGSTALLTY